MRQSSDLNRIRLFLAIAQAGNLTRAAKATGVRKAKLSRDLALLEEQLGLQLVYRTTRQFHLTEVGKRLNEGAKSLVRDLDAFIDELSSGAEAVAGTVTLTCPEDLGHLLVLPVLDDFRTHYPKVMLNLRFTSDVVDLVADGIDLAVRAGSMEDSSLHRKKLGRGRMIVVCAPQLAAGLEASDDPASFCDAPAVALRSEGGAEPRWLLRRGATRRTLAPSSKIIVDNYLAVLDFAVRGHGLAVVPQFVAAPYLASGKLQRLLEDWSLPSPPIQIVWPEQREMPRRVRLLIDALATAIEPQIQ